MGVVATALGIRKSAIQRLFLELALLETLLRVGRRFAEAVDWYLECFCARF
jgi:hypothetical protein